MKSIEAMCALLRLEPFPVLGIVLLPMHLFDRDESTAGAIDRRPIFQALNAADYRHPIQLFAHGPEYWPPERTTARLRCSLAATHATKPDPGLNPPATDPVRVPWGDAMEGGSQTSRGSGVAEKKLFNLPPHRLPALWHGHR